MVSRWIVVLLLGRFLFALPLHSANTKDAQFITDAIEKMNILVLPSFEVDANVRIDSDGKPLQGSYRLLWNGPQQWREELSFPGFEEIRVARIGTVFLKRSTDFLPLRIYQVHAAFGYGGYGPGAWSSFLQMAPRDGEAIDKIGEHKEHGDRIKCAEIIDSKKQRREVCVDESEGIIVRRHPFVDTGAIHVGTREIPRSMGYVENGKAVAQLVITNFKSPAEFPGSIFAPPDGVAGHSECFNPSPPRRIHGVSPKYPERERESNIQGTVGVYAIIDTGGIPRGLRVVSSVTPGLNDSALDAIRNWAYEPATCEGTPVDSETILTVNYSLQR
jgi:TonB family protein